MLYTFNNYTQLQSILISCGVHPTICTSPSSMFFSFFFFLTMGHFDWPSRKRNLIFLIFPQIEHFLPTCNYDRVSLQSPIYNTRTNFCTKDMGEIVLILFQRILLKQVHLASSHYLSKIYIPNFVHHHIWPRTLQKLGYLL